MTPIKIYLDSSDYSVMSDPKRTSESESVLEVLSRLVEDGTVSCHYSGIHLCEMAPASADFSDAAHRRSELLAQLCRRSALISLDRLFRLEVSGEGSGPPPVHYAHSASGEWYPEDFVSPLDEIDFEAMLESHFMKKGYSPEVRQMVKVKLLRDGRPTPELAEGLRLNDRLQVLVDNYPISQQAQSVMWRYISGAADAAEASDALLSGLLDPAWMMKWFAAHHDQLSPFIRWARKPAEELLETFAGIADYIARTRTENVENEAVLRQITDHLSPLTWGAKTDETLLTTYTNLRRRSCGESSGEVRVDSAESVRAACPGLSAALGSLASASRSSFLANPRRGLKSDFIDALHAAYAPYVDIFRADGFMSDHVRKHTGRYGVVVVGRLRDLPAAIEARSAAT